MFRSFVACEHRLPRIRELLAKRVTQLPHDTTTHVEEPAARQLVESDAAHEGDVDALLWRGSGDERFDIEPRVEVVTRIQLLGGDEHRGAGTGAAKGRELRDAKDGFQPRPGIDGPEEVAG